MSKKCRGSCLCGIVEYEINGNLGMFQYCHCSRCQKVTGSAHAANLLVRPDQFKWLQGESEVRYYTNDDFKYFGSGFCSTCGSNLPWLSKSGKAYIVPAGTLNDDPGIKPDKNIFCGSRGDWYKHVKDLPEFDVMPPSR